MLLIAFMVAVGLSFLNPEYFTPFAPYGGKGVLRGATSCFFGFVGYDEVCCMSRWVAGNT
jgi:APA family basic amino acid/polyamine antiporter